MANNISINADDIVTVGGKRSWKQTNTSLNAVSVFGAYEGLLVVDVTRYDSIEGRSGSLTS